MRVLLQLLMFIAMAAGVVTILAAAVLGLMGHGHLAGEVARVGGWSILVACACVFVDIIAF